MRLCLFFIFCLKSFEAQFSGERTNQTRCAASFQASGATIYKIANLSYKYLINQIPNFHSFLIVSKDVETDYPTELVCECDDKRLSTHGLPCRVDCVIKYFYYNLTERWLFVGGDDDWINFNALDRILDALEEEWILSNFNKFLLSHHSTQG